MDTGGRVTQEQLPRGLPLVDGKYKTYSKSHMQQITNALALTWVGYIVGAI